MKLKQGKIERIYFINLIIISLRKYLYMEMIEYLHHKIHRSKCAFIVLNTNIRHPNANVDP